MWAIIPYAWLCVICCYNIMSMLMFMVYVLWFKDIVMHVTTYNKIIRIIN